MGVRMAKNEVVSPYPRITTEELPAILVACYLARKSLMIWGEPGTAKTAIVDACGRWVGGAGTQVLIARNRAPHEITGVQAVVDHRVVTVIPEEIDVLFEHKKGLLFFDEFPTAPEDSRAGCLRITNERKLNNRPFPDGVGIVLAGNPPETSTGGGSPLSTAESNRLVHVEVEANRPDIHDRWVRNGCKDPDFHKIAKHIPKDWELGVDKWKMLTAIFGTSCPKYFHNEPKNVSQHSSPWPSRRSWTDLARLLAVTDNPGFNAGLRQTLINGTVGAAAGVAFAAWLKENLVDPMKVLADPKTLTEKMRDDELLITLVSVVEIGMRKSKQATVSQVCAVLERVIDLKRQDLVVGPGKQFFGYCEREGVDTAPVVARLKGLASVLRGMYAMAAETGVKVSM